MIIYAPKITNRLHYTFNIIFNRILKIEYTIIENPDDWAQGSKPLISYSPEPLPGSFHILPAGLLFEKSISEQNIHIGNYKGLPVLFFTDKGDILFDIFSAVFYMLSRYEEYLPFEADIHGRFPGEQSLAYKNNFHQLPVVELWCKLLAEKLDVNFPASPYNFNLTVDIDNAWKHKHKGVFRTTASFIKLILKGNAKELLEKIKVLTGVIEDPSNTFDYLEKIEGKLKNPVQYFVLAGVKGKHDRAISVKKKAYQNLLKKLHAKNPVGIHPSYLSFHKPGELEKEYFSLCAVFAKKIIKSRQHFLLLNFPDTFRKLIKLGVREEYSMGWYGITGFRAGISRPFPFYDLKAEKETRLMLVPFAAMDRTYKNYLKYTPEEAIADFKTLCDAVKPVSGEYTILWHNDNLSDKGEWNGWKKVFEKTIEYAGSTD